MNGYSSILVAIDLNNYSDKVVIAAQEIAKRFNAKLYIIHVVLPFPFWMCPINQINELEQKMVMEAKNRLKHIGLKYGIPIVQLFVKLGDSSNVILEKAQAIDADLIVLGNHIKADCCKIIGSAATKILMKAEPDVLLVNFSDDMKV